ncbi:MAG TPA: sigma 54-interacting transcriptional regulator [Terriglobia bacterium]|nr:sigma 54-interacting transcriptional regulator [Terriglobia bacterium]
MKTSSSPYSALNSLGSEIFQRVFESAPDGIAVTDTEGIIIAANARMENLFGYIREELLGQPVEMLVPERFRSTHSSERKSYHADPRMRPMGAGLNLFARRKDSTEFPVDIMLSPIATPEGTHVLAIVRDVTQRKQAEDALRQSEERLRLLIEGIRDYAILMLSAEGKILSWSGGAEQIKGYKAEEIVGQHVSRFYTPADVERGKVEEELRLAAESGRVEEEGWRVRKDGSRFWANSVTTALRDAEGKLLGFVKVGRDITEHKKAEEALLLEITSVLLSNLDIRKLLAAISATVRQVMPHEYASLGLYDPQRKKLILHVLTSPDSLKLSTEEMLIPLDGTPGGWVFSTRQPLMLDRLDPKRFPNPTTQHLLDAGVKSGCWLPLISHGRVLGTLGVGSVREEACSAANLNLLSQVANQVALAIDNAVAFRQITELNDRLAEEKQYLEDELRTEYNFEEIVGQSALIKRVLKQVETVAPVGATVLILGETGTGKELIARAIHNLSERRERTFVKLNCAAIPAGLLESELFGHERGAFTGAIAQKIGRLELAHRGTLFLDEVGDLPPELQPKLLRAIQEREFERVGGTRTIPVDVRLVAATNQDLEQMVKEHRFRSDLYYRLKVFPIVIPPLRHRPEDIPILAHYFAQKHARRMNKRIDHIPPETLQLLSRYPWPGNVRELENFIERAVILSRGPALRIPVSELKPLVEPESPSTDSTLEDAEREHILRVLRETHGVIGGPHGAATRLGIKRTTLNFKMKKLGIKRDDL